MLRGNSTDAPEELIAYKYREKFGLSQEEFLREPLSVFRANLEIMNIEAELQEEEIKKQERQARMRSATIKR